MAECAKGVYRPRRPRETAFYRLVEEHYERFEQVYPERYEDGYGFFRPIIRDTVYKYLGCGDLKQGFARLRRRSAPRKALDKPNPTPSFPIIILDTLGGASPHAKAAHVVEGSSYGWLKEARDG